MTNMSLRKGIPAIFGSFRTFPQYSNQDRVEVESVTA